MTATTSVRISTPGWRDTLEGIARLRLEADDGARGVLPGHEPARVCLTAGAVEVVDLEGRSRFIATEGGLAWIDREAVTLVSTWATIADDLPALREAVLARRRTRARIEQQARATAHRHEVATRRALSALRKEAP